MLLSWRRSDRIHDAVLKTTAGWIGHEEVVLTTIDTRITPILKFATVILKANSSFKVLADSKERE